MRPKATRPVDVLIVGGGAAGLAAAREVSQAGLSAIVLEARDRLGGRVNTIHDPTAGAPVELGAEFVHGEAQETMRIVDAAGLHLDQLPDSHLRTIDGRLHVVNEFWGTVQRALNSIAKRAKATRGDRSLAAMLPTLRVPAATRRLVLDFVEGYHAANPDLISATSLREGDEEVAGEAGRRQHRIVNGYDAVLMWLLAGLDPERVQVRLNTEALALQWKRGHVTIRCRSTMGIELGPVTARAAIVTVPAAVLKAGTLRFEPELPSMRNALDGVATASVFKVVLQFRERFWHDDAFIKRRLTARRGRPPELVFLHAAHSPVPTWWTPFPARDARVTGWAGGAKADAMLAEPPATRIDRTLDALASALAVQRRMLDELCDRWWMHDWSADPFSRGAYSYVSVGGQRRQRALARPVAGTLFFAGEATESEEMATVAGALRSGRRAGREAARRPRG